MIDSHCHLTHRRLHDEVESVINRAREAGIEACVSIGTGVEDATRVVELTRRYPGFVFGTAGLDPFSAHAAADRFDAELERLELLLRRERFLAVGEIGLDYHYDLDPRPTQAERLRRQLVLAEELDLPVVLHVRDAHEDLAAILADHPGNRGVIHSFTAGPAEAERYLELGWYLAFNGVLTFPKAPEVREAARLVPLDRLLLETDSPYLAPVPLRGRRCEPGYVAHVLARLADLRGDSPELLDQRTTANARTLFRLP